MGGSFDPVHASHAIERVTATVVFAEHIPSREWPPVFRALQDCANSLDLNRYMDGIQVFPAASEMIEGQYPTMGLTMVNSAKFARVSEEGFEEFAILANRSGMQVESRRYIRWSGYEEVLRETIRKVGSAYPESSSVIQIRLEYEDKFVETNCRAPRSSWGDLLVSGDLVTQSHLDRSSSWHVHTGWFEEYEGIGSALINLNVSAIGEVRGIPESPRSMGIQCQVTLNDVAIPAQDTDTLMRRMDWLHQRSKNVVRSILTADMRRRISIDVEE